MNDRWRKAAFLLAAVLAVSLAGACVQAQDVYIVQSRAGGLNHDHYSETGTLGDSNSQGTAPGLIVGIGSRIMYGQGFDPPDRSAIYHFTPNVTSDYNVYVTWVPSTNGNTAFHHVITHEDTGSGTVTELQMDQTKNGSTWVLLGKFHLLAGKEYTVVQDNKTGGGVGRCEAIKWEKAGNPCLNTPDVKVVGPLAAGQTTVTVTEVTGPASGVKVYTTDGTTATPIGTGSNTDLGGGRVAAGVTPLFAGERIVATQTINTQEGCVPTTGLLVGYGPNTAVKLTLGVRDGVAQAPIGSDGGGTNDQIEWIGATDQVQAGFNAAPIGKTVFPSPSWQTVTFAAPLAGGTDPVRIPTYGGTGGGVLDGPYGVIEELAVTMGSNPCDRYNVGNYVLYIDNVKNGTTTVEDFEAYAAGTSEVLFNLPKDIDFSGFMLTEPNLSVIDDTKGDASSKSLRVEWQFAPAIANSWVRLSTLDAPGGRPNPVVDLTKPISFRILLLSVNMDGTLSITNPADKTVVSGSDATFSVTPSGAVGTVKYQWYKNRYPVGTSSPTLTLPGVGALDNGAKIMVVACDSQKTVYSSEATLTITVKPGPVGDAIGKPDGAEVEMSNAVVVTHSTATDFWVQEQDRSAGIRVMSTQNPPVNTLVTGLKGIMRTDANTTERYIEAGGNVTLGAAYTPLPLGTSNKTVGGSKPAGGAGLPDVGLLVKIWGKVTAFDFTDPFVAFVDDGSGVANDTPAGLVMEKVPGVKVTPLAPLGVFPTPGDFVVIRGIVRLQKVGDPATVIRVVEPLEILETIQ